MNQPQRQFSLLSLLGLLVLGIFVTTLTACSEDQPPPPKLTPQQQQLLEQQRQQSEKDHTVAKAWQMEQSLVDMGPPGTRAWQKTEKQELLANGFVYGYKGQYSNEVKDSQSLATDPDNIKWVKCNAAPEPATTWQSERRSILLLKAQEAEAASWIGKVKAWFSLLGIGIGIVVLVFLMISFMKTIDGDPGFIMVIFLIIIGVLLWKAVPAWNDYIAKGECVTLLEKVKKPVADFYTQKNLWPTSLSEEVCVNPVGKYVYLTTSVDGKTALQCTIEGGKELSKEVSAAVLGKTLLFSYNPQTKAWQCEAGSGTLEQKYRPEGCRAK